MALWGDLNAALNRLVTAGTIARYWTNLGQRKPLLAVHVIVAPPVALSDADAGKLQAAVSAELASLSEDVTVTVDRSAKADLAELSVRLGLAPKPDQAPAPR